MNNIAVDIQTKLKAKGYKTTAVRSVLLSIFAGQSSPVSVNEILNELKTQGLLPNKSTVYRELDILLKECILVELDLGEGKKRYELSKAGRHCHLICNGCAIVICLDNVAQISVLENEIASAFNVKITDSKIDFSGLCSVCKQI